MTRLWLSDETQQLPVGASTSTVSAIEKFAAALRENPAKRFEAKRRVAGLVVELLHRVTAGYEKERLIPTLDLLTEELTIIAYANKSPSAKQRKRIAEISVHPPMAK